MVYIYWMVYFALGASLARFLCMLNFCFCDYHASCFPPMFKISLIKSSGHAGSACTLVQSLSYNCICSIFCIFSLPLAIQLSVASGPFLFCLISSCQSVPTFYYFRSYYKYPCMGASSLNFKHAGFLLSQDFQFSSQYPPPSHATKVLCITVRHSISPRLLMSYYMGKTCFPMSIRWPRPCRIQYW